MLVPEKGILLKKITCTNLNFLSIEPPKVGDSFPCFVKVRYHHKPAKAVVNITKDDTAEVTFEEPVKLAAPGQSAVFYDDEGCIIGGGIIK